MTVQQIMDRKTKRFTMLKKIALILALAAVVAFALFFVLNATLPNPNATLLSVLFALPSASCIYMLIGMGLYYLVAIRGLKANQKWLAQIGMADRGADILINKKAKISCGRYAMALPGGIVIPYSQISWIYLHVTRYYGIITTSKQYQFHMANGKMRAFQLEEKDLRYLLENFIIPANPNVAIGFTPQARQKHTQNVQAYKARYK